MKTVSQRAGTTLSRPHAEEHREAMRLEHEAARMLQRRGHPILRDAILRIALRMRRRENRGVAEETTLPAPLYLPNPVKPPPEVGQHLIRNRAGLRRDLVEFEPAADQR